MSGSCQSQQVLSWLWRFLLWCGIDSLVDQADFPTALSADKQTHFISSLSRVNCPTSEIKRELSVHKDKDSFISRSVQAFQQSQAKNTVFLSPQAKHCILGRQSLLGVISKIEALLETPGAPGSR